MTFEDLEAFIKNRDVVLNILMDCKSEFQITISTFKGRKTQVKAKNLKDAMLLAQLSLDSSWEMAKGVPSVE
jgi:hypothetical protein